MEINYDALHSIEYLLDQNINYFVIAAKVSRGRRKLQ